MLTVMVCLVWSGKSSTRRPFASRYSVMPSTVVTRSGTVTDTAGGGATAAGGAFGFFASQTGARSAAHNTIDALKRKFIGMTHSRYLLEGARLYRNVW